MCSGRKYKMNQRNRKLYVVRVVDRGEVYPDPDPRKNEPGSDIRRKYGSGFDLLKKIHGSGNFPILT